MAAAIRHDVRIIVEIVPQSEGVSKFMCRCSEAKSPMNQRIASIFSLPASSSSRTPRTSNNCIYTIVNDKEVNVRIEIKHLFNLVIHSLKCVIKIVTIGVLTVHAMNHRLALHIGFKAEGFVPVSVHLHLIAVEGLNPANRNFHRINHFCAKRTVIGQEVDQPHGAGFANIQVKRLLASGIGAIALSHFFKIDRQAKMHVVGFRWLRRSISDRREGETGQREQACAQHTWGGETNN